jgi:membrane protease YdiL (CAAX protease family)
MSAPPLGRLCVYFALITAGAFGGAVVAAVITPRAVAPAYAWLIKGTLVMALIVAITHGFLRRENRTWREFCVMRAALPASVLRGVALGMALALAWSIALYVFIPYSVAANSGLSIAAFVAASLGTVGMGIAEEVGYRTYGLLGLRTRLGYTAAVLSTTALFVAAHVAGGVPWLAALCVVGTASVLFAVLMVETRNLPLVVAVHVASNLVQDNVLRTSGQASLLEMHTLAPAGASDTARVWVAMGAINLLTAAAVLAWRRRQPQPSA